MDANEQKLAAERLCKSRAMSLCEAAEVFGTMPHREERLTVDFKHRCAHEYDAFVYLTGAVVPAQSAGIAMTVVCFPTEEAAQEMIRRARSLGLPIEVLPERFVRDATQIEVTHA